jgi:hypothetical protein
VCSRLSVPSHNIMHAVRRPHPPHQGVRLMSVLIYGPSQVRLTFANNSFLAHLQAATNRRFAEGRGYFLTTSGTGDDGQERRVSYWMHPSIPLLFSYDAEDVTGEPTQPVEVTDDGVDALVEVMDRPLGVIWGFSAEQGRYIPFVHCAAAPQAETATE